MSTLKERVDERRKLAEQQTSPASVAPTPVVTPAKPAAAPTPVTATTKPQNANTAKQPFEKLTSTVVLNAPDVDVMDSLDLWVKKSRIRIGRKIGLTAYARAGLRLLNDLTKTDPVAAEALIRATADKD